MTPATALAAALAVEHQVIYGYGVAGAHLVGADRRAALAALGAHRVRRDQLAALLRPAAAPAGAPAYALPFPVTDPVSARRLCAELEDGCAGAAWDLAAAAGPRQPARTLAVGSLADAASRGAYWRGGQGTNPALPGAPA
jgi:hypothetical protein